MNIQWWIEELSKVNKLEQELKITQDKLEHVNGLYLTCVTEKNQARFSSMNYRNEMLKYKNILEDLGPVKFSEDLDVKALRADKETAQRTIVRLMDEAVAKDKEIARLRKLEAVLAKKNRIIETLTGEDKL